MCPSETLILAMGMELLAMALLGRLDSSQQDSLLRGGQANVRLVGNGPRSAAAVTPRPEEGSPRQAC